MNLVPFVYKVRCCCFLRRIDHTKLNSTKPQICEALTVNEKVVDLLTVFYKASIFWSPPFLYISNRLTDRRENWECNLNWILESDIKAAFTCGSYFSHTLCCTCVWERARVQLLARLTHFLGSHIKFDVISLIYARTWWGGGGWRGRRWGVEKLRRLPGLFYVKLEQVGL